MADDPEQLGARRGDVDLGRPQRPHLGAARAAVDSRGAARERGAAGARVRCSRASCSRAGAARATARRGPAASTASSSTTKDFVWIGGRAGWPRQTTPGVSDDMILKFTMAGQARDADRPAAARARATLDTENVHQATDVFVDTQAKEVYAADGYGNKRVIVFDSETGKFKRMWGAFGNPPPATFAANAADAAAADDARRAAGVRVAARDQGVARRRRLRRRSHQQPHPAVHARREVSEAGARHERRQRRRAGPGRLRVLARREAAVSSTSSTRGRCAS